MNRRELLGSLAAVATGGVVVMKTVPAMCDTSAVLPTNISTESTTTVVLELDGQRMAEIIARELPRVIRQQGLA